MKTILCDMCGKDNIQQDSLDTSKLVPQYDKNNVQIKLGDRVRWRNTEGVVELYSDGDGYVGFTIGKDGYGIMSMMQEEIEILQDSLDLPTN